VLKGGVCARWAQTGCLEHLTDFSADATMVAVRDPTLTSLGDD
jgi:hypothetical protein